MYFYRETMEKNNLKVEFIYTTAVNYAIQQNKIPIIRKLNIENLSDNDLIGIKVKINCEPAFASNWVQNIDILPSNQYLILDVKNFILSPSLLSELTEKIVGVINLTISNNNNEIIFQENYAIDVLAYDQWNGIGKLPEMIASFLTPNHPEI